MIFPAYINLQNSDNNIDFPALEGYDKQQRGYINEIEMNSEITESLRNKTQRFQNHSSPPAFTRKVDGTEIRKILIV